MAEEPLFDALFDDRPELLLLLPVDPVERGTEPGLEALLVVDLLAEEDGEERWTVREPLRLHSGQCAEPFDGPRGVFERLR